MIRRLSENPIEGEEKILNQEIIVDQHFSRSSPVLFDQCVFRFEAGARVTLTRCIIKNCSFVGLDSFENYNNPNDGYLHIGHSKVVEGITFEKSFSCINILNVEVQNLIDISSVKNYNIQQSKIIDFNIKGECEKLEVHHSVFTLKKDKTTIWDKKIIITANCEKTIFEKVRINPFYLATKCDDKKSLDLTSAVIIDDWSKLRKKYAGLSLFIVFLLTFLFFLPIITHSFVLILSSKLNPDLLPIKELPLWEVLLYGGKHGFYAFSYACLTIILLLYNIGRMYMSISIAKLREEEKFLKDANFQLVSIHPDKIKTQLKIDWWLSLMLYISLGYSFLKFIDTLNIFVPTLLT